MPSEDAREYPERKLRWSIGPSPGFGRIAKQQVARPSAVRPMRDTTPDHGHPRPPGLAPINRDIEIFVILGEFGDQSSCPTWIAVGLRPDLRSFSAAQSSRTRSTQQIE